MFSFKKWKSNPPSALATFEYMFKYPYIFRERYFRMIRKSDLSKTHGHDKMSICMLKLSDKTSFKPLHMITPCLEAGYFPLH